MGIQDKFKRSRAKTEDKDAKRAKARAEKKPNPLLIEAKRMIARKRFGQNFLVHQGTIDGIVRCLDLSPTDNVLEIGPGLGFLTRSLLPQVEHLTAVELDYRMVDYLGDYFRRTTEWAKMNLVSQDIMSVDVPALMPSERFKVVGNLPYNITSGVLFKFAGEMTQTDMSLRKRVQQLTFMVQKEVGERITAKEGSKDYGPLTIALQYWFDCQLEFLVPPTVFEPQPKVMSVVISLYPRQEGLCPVSDLTLMQRVVRTTFQQRRKMLRNTLLNDHLVKAEELEGVLEASGVDPQARPETLSIEAFAKLTDAIHALPR